MRGNRWGTKKRRANCSPSPVLAIHSRLWDCKKKAAGVPNHFDSPGELGAKTPRQAGCMVMTSSHPFRGSSNVISSMLVFKRRLY